MARYITLAAALVSVAFSYPDAPLYPNNVVFASVPLLRQPAQAAPPQFVSRTINNGAYTLQSPVSSSPTILVAGQPNQRNAAAPQRVIASPAASAPQVFQIVSDGAPTQTAQSVPRNFVTFSRTPALIQAAQSPAEPVQPAPSNFVTFARTPVQQVVQSPAESVQSVPRNFATFTRGPQPQLVQVQAQQQDLGSPVTQFAVRQSAQQQFGLRNVFVPAPNDEANPAQNASPAQRSGIRTVIVFPSQQTSPQAGQADQRVRAVAPQFVPAQPVKPRTVLVARPAQTPEQTELSGNVQNQPPVVSSSQFFTRNFGGSGAVTYFIQPLSAAAGQVVPSNQPSPDPET